jgi:CheY-like chemotaxis protein
MSAQKRRVPASDDQSVPVVLLVEDEVLIRMAIADYLRSCGYRVIEAGSADEAVAVIDGRARIDVVFTDVKMPGSMDGFGLARCVRQRLPGIPVVLTSGVHRSTDSRRAVRRRAADGEAVSALAGRGADS